MACGAFLVCTALAACGGAEPTAASSTAELRVGFPEASVAQQELGVGQFATLLSLEGLTFGNVDGRPLPRLAERWTWEANGLALRIHLRPGVFLHDGRPFNAATAVPIFTENVARPRNQSLYPSLSDIDSVSIAGDRQMVIHLSRPSGFLLDDLAMQLSTGRGNAIGTGPFRLTKRSTEETVLERFDQYYQGAPAISRIVVTPFDTMRTAWAGLLRGNFEMVSDVPAEAVQFIRNDEVQTLTYQRWYQFLFAFNAQRPQLRSPAVRRALNLAVDRQAIIDNALRGYGVPSTGPIWPEHWAYDRSRQPFTFDPRQAESLLDAAGFPRGTGARISPMRSARMRLTCIMPDGFSTYERIGLDVQKQLYAVGVDLQFDIMSVTAYSERLQASDFDCALIDMISGPTLARPYSFWRSGKRFSGIYNTFGYENDHAERLFEQLRTSTNETVIRAATNGLQQVFLDDPPALFLVWNQRTRAVRSEFHVAREPNRDPLLTVGQWTTGPGTQASLR